jgi:hypothetical protein
MINPTKPKRGSKYGLTMSLDFNLEVEFVVGRHTNIEHVCNGGGGGGMIRKKQTKRYCTVFWFPKARLMQSARPAVIVLTMHLVRQSRET